MTPPIAIIATRSHVMLPMPGVSTVASTAIAMPTMPYQMPRFALSWFESPPRDRMKSTLATT